MHHRAAKKKWGSRKQFFFLFFSFQPLHRWGTYVKKKALGLPFGPSEKKE